MERQGGREGGWDVCSAFISSGSIFPSLVSPAPVFSARIASDPVYSVPISSASIFPSQVFSAPVSPAPILSTHISSAPISPAPVSSAPVCSTPVSAAVGAALHSRCVAAGTWLAHGWHFTAGRRSVGSWLAAAINGRIPAVVSQRASVLSILVRIGQVCLMRSQRWLKE
jgi:hypothetical protein